MKRVLIVVLVIIILAIANLIYFAPDIFDFNSYDYYEFSFGETHEPYTVSGRTNYGPGESFVVYIWSDEIAGWLGVKVSLPETPRYEEGAPILIYTSTFLTENTGFDNTFVNITDYGFVHVSYLWPGEYDDFSYDFSDGEFDHGGPVSLSALKDVIAFASGDIVNFSSMPLLTENLGLYAFSHPGIAATNVMALYGDELSGVDYFVGRENPTVDTITAVEIGYFDNSNPANRPVINPLYEYPDSYSPTDIDIDYSSVLWDFEGDRPYFDLNGNGEPDKNADYLMGSRTPSMWGYRYYSTDLLNALLDNGALSFDTWPWDLAFPAFAEEDWPFRSTVFNYPKLATNAPNLHVMLVFADKDHVQVAFDKPHIHQAYDGFSSAGLWVRLNPDSAYVEDLDPSMSSPDNLANTEPEDWMDIIDWSYAAKRRSSEIFGQAGVLEMADRTYYNDWSDDLDAVLHN